MSIQIATALGTECILRNTKTGITPHSRPTTAPATGARALYLNNTDNKPDANDQQGCTGYINNSGL
jgi:hypothetical protein